jgi:NTE family protein
VDAALPRSFAAGYGHRVDRGLSLGGGGLFFVAWQAAYLSTLAAHGMQFETSDRVVGTSAGSVVASALTGGRLSRLASEIKLLAKVPALVSALAPDADLHPSQQLALDLFTKATDGDPATVQPIGHAGLAAMTPKPGVI